MTSEQMATLIYGNTGRLIHLEDRIQALTDKAALTPTPETVQHSLDISQRFDTLSTAFKDALHRHHDTTTILLQTKYETTNTSIADLYARIHELASHVVELQALLARRPPETPFTYHPLPKKPDTEDTDA